MDLQGVNLAKLNYLFQNFLSYIFLVRLSQKGNSWRSGRVEGKQKSFCNTYIFFYLHLQLLHLPRNLLQLVCFLDQVCVFNFTLRTLASAGHPQNQGQRQQLLTWVSVYPHWVQVHIGGFQLVFPFQLYNNLLLFWLSALCTLKSSIRHEDNSFTETC